MNTNQPQTTSLLDKINFEDQAYLLNLYDNLTKTSQEKALFNLNAFNNFCVSSKLLSIISEPQTLPNTQASQSFIKVLKIYSTISLYKTKFILSSTTESTLDTDLGMIIHSIYSI